MEVIPVTFAAIEEAEPGPRWQALFRERWPSYQRWFLQEGEAARPSYATSARMLRAHLPELVPVYERLVELAGGGDLEARMLAMYRPPPYLAACSQGVWGGEQPILVRNYDYAPSRLEGVVFSSTFGGRRVVGMGDCLWGLLDGMNDAGLAVSLTFGGRRVLGDGFGIPIILRYVLQTCSTVGEAQEVLARVPVNLAHNVTVIDRAGEPLTAYLAPDREPIFRRLGVATNHQGPVEWVEQARATRTVEREVFVLGLLEDPGVTREAFVDAFLQPPLFSNAYANGFGTLYTAAYSLPDGRIEYRWPSFTWEQSLHEFREGTHIEELEEGSVA